MPPSEAGVAGVTGIGRYNITGKERKENDSHDSENMNELKMR